MRDCMDRRVPNLSGLPHLPVPTFMQTDPSSVFHPIFAIVKNRENRVPRKEATRRFGTEDLIEDINGAIQKYCYMFFLKDCKFCMRNTIG